MHNTLLVVSTMPDRVEPIDDDIAVDAINNYNDIADYAQAIEPRNYGPSLDAFDFAYGQYVDIDGLTIHVRPSLSALKAHLEAASGAARVLIEQVDLILANELDGDAKAQPEKGSSILYRTMALVNRVDSALIDHYGIYVLTVDDEPTWAPIAKPADEWLIHAQAEDACDYTITQIFDYHV